MKTAKDKISVRQLFFVFTIIVSSPTTRYLPKYSATKAEQAGWLSPIVSALPFIMLILIIDYLLNKFEGQSMSEIINSVLGKYLGKLIEVLYLLWALLLTAMYLRYYAERLTNTIYSNINNEVLILLTLIPIAYMLRSGFTVIARMSEILLPFIGTALVILSVFLLPKVRADNLLPVYFNDIVPIIKGSISTTAILAYVFLMFFLSDKVVNLKSLRKFGYITTFVNIISIAAVTFIVIGVLGSSTVKRSPLPVLVSVKQISILDTIENIDAIVIAMWIFADFTLVSAMLVITLNLIKSVFKLSYTNPLINMLSILIYFLSMGISISRFELEAFSNSALTWINLVMGYGFPFVLFVLSMFKKKNKTAKTN